MLWVLLHHERLHGFDGHVAFRELVLLKRLLLLVQGEWILGDQLLSCHVQACEQQVGLDSGHHVILLLGDQVTCLHFEILFVLAFGLLDVVAERLLLDAGSDHLFLVLRELLVRHGWLDCASLTRSLIAVRFLFIEASVLGSSSVRIVFLEVLSIPKWGGPVQVRLQGSLHIWQLALHARVPVVLDGVVRATLEHLCDLCPLIADYAVHQEKDPLFLLVPVDLLDAGVQVVVPALATLLAHPAI